MEVQLSSAEIEELRAAFNLFDLDGGGDIDAKELGTVMRSLGANPSEDEVQAMIEEVDDDNSGCIEFPEFCELYARPARAAAAATAATDRAFIFRAVFLARAAVATG